VVQGGDYRFRARLKGDSARPASAEIAPAGGRAFKTFTLAAGADWAQGGGTAHLDPGAYTASVLLPAGCGLERLEVAPSCVASVEPVGGWLPTAVTTVEDVAVTAVRAMDLESELPPAEPPLELSGSAFEVDEKLAQGSLEPGFAGESLKAGNEGLRGLVSVVLKEPGLYTLSVFGTAGAGQRWVADACRKSVVCPASGSGWRVVMSQPLNAGRHTLAVNLGDGAVVERIRLERKKDAPADYLATLRRLGFDPGPDGPVARDKAVAAMGFVRGKHRERAGKLCGDPSLPEFQPPPGAQVAGAGTQVAGRPVVPNPPPPPNVFTPSLLPPQEPASPVSPVGTSSSSSSR
jgi:hypothetical protein